MITHRHQTILGDIPSDWHPKYLKELLSDHYAGDWGDENGEALVNVLRSTNFTESGALDLSDVARRYFPAGKAATFSLKRGDLLLERSGGGPDQPVGRIGFVPEDLDGFTVSNFVQVLRPDTEKVVSDYLGWLLYELQRCGVIERLQQQSTQMRNLNFRDYLRLRLPYPETTEQGRISAVIRLADTALEKTQAELDATRRLKQALMQELFEKGIIAGRPTKKHKIHRCYEANIPVDWDADSLGKNVVLVEYGTNEPSNDYGAGYPVIAIPQVVAPHLSLSDVPYAEVSDTEAEALRLQENDVLLIRTNGNPEFIGKSTIVTKEVAEKHVVFASYLIRIRTQPEKLLGAYLNYFLASPLGRRQALAVSNTSAGNNNIGARALKQFRLPRPSKDEQEDIVRLVDRIENKVTSGEQVIDTLIKLKKSLLQNLLTGKVRIPAGAIDVA